MDTSTDSHPRKPAIPFALIGTALVLIGGISYPLLLDNAWIRSKAIPNIALVIIGMLLCGWAVACRRSILTIAGAGLSTIVGGLFLASVFLFMNLPAPSKSWRDGEMAPDFVLSNQNDQQVRLSSFRNQGPVLLVFYRGHW